MEHEIQRKNEALKSLESEVGKLQCGLICEKEQIATLCIEQSDIRGQLQKARDQKKKLEAELDAVAQESQAKVLECKAMQLQRLLFFVYFYQSEHNQVLMSQLQDESRLTAEQLETLSNQYTLLDAENKHCRQLLDSANDQIAKLKEMMTTSSNDLGSVYETNETLQKELRYAREQLDNATRALSRKVSKFQISFAYGDIQDYSVCIGYCIGLGPLYWQYHLTPRADTTSTTRKLSMQ